MTLSRKWSSPLDAIGKSLVYDYGLHKIIAMSSSLIAHDSESQSYYWPTLGNLD